MARHDLLLRLRAAFEGDNKGLNALDLIHKFGRAPAAILYSELYWPDLREFRGMVFLSDAVEDKDDEARVDALLEKFDDQAEVEKSMNEVWVPLLFGRTAGQSTAADVELLVRRLREMWAARLRTCFPDRAFRVEAGDADEDGVVVVCFSEVRGRPV